MRINVWSEPYHVLVSNRGSAPPNKKEHIMYEPTRQFLSSNVAGFSHWYGLEVLDSLRPGAELRLVPEPDNPYDPCAVAVFFDKTKIGYVPRALNSTLSQLMFFGHGDIFKAVISQVNLDVHPERQVRMTIFVRDSR